MDKKIFVILATVLLFFSSSFLLVSNSSGKDLTVHIVKGCLYVNDKPASDDFDLFLVFDDDIINGEVFSNGSSEGFNFNIGFKGYDGEEGFFQVLYNGEMFLPVDNKSIVMDRNQERYYLDLHVEIDGLDNKKPVADAGGPYNGFRFFDIVFDGSESFDSDGNITGYRWDFDGDGVFDTGWNSSASGSYVFDSSGNFTVILQVRDRFGAVDQDSSYVGVEFNESQPPDKVDGLSGDFSSGKVFLEWNLGVDNLGVKNYYVYRDDEFLTQVDSTSYEDGSVESGMSYTYEVCAVDYFDNVGRCSDSVTVVVPSEEDGDDDFVGDDDDEDDDGGYSGDSDGDGGGEVNGDSDSSDSDDTKDEENLFLSVDAIGPGKVNTGEKVSFSGSVSGGESPYSYSWSFGDNGSSTGEKVNHVFKKSGNYTVVLRVSDNNGLSSRDSFKVQVVNGKKKSSGDGKGFFESISDFFGGIGGWFGSLGNENIHFLPIVVFGVVLVVAETFLVVFIKKKGFFKI